MKIAISGASGFIGKQLVSLLNKDCHDIVLLGRNKSKIDLLFSGYKFCEYENIENKISNFDIFIHLSALNNNSKKSLHDFLSVNLNFSLDIFKKVKDSNVKKIINFSSVHCLDKNKVDNYTISKKKLIEHLEKNSELNIISFLLPAVYGEKFSNKLSFLNFFPKNMKQILFKLISSFKATANINEIHKFIVSKELFLNQNTVIISDNQNNNFFYRFYNKFLDISFAVLIIIFFWWLYIIIFIFIKIFSKGPAIYKQKRVGLFMKEFTCYKFRTMKVDTPNLATHKIQDSYVTKVGLFLRKYKLDELPQALNILKGEMSLIGPRPCLPNQIELIKERDERNIFTIKPGISGWAAVNNVDMSNPKLLAQTDEEYLKLRSISLDIKIIIKTLLGSGFVDRTK